MKCPICFQPLINFHPDKFCYCAEEHCNLSLGKDLEIIRYVYEPIFKVTRIFGSKSINITMISSLKDNSVLIKVPFISINKDSFDKEVVSIHDRLMKLQIFG